MVSRIITSACDKCKGAVKQSYEDPREWSCMNCGKLFLFLNSKELEIQSLNRTNKRRGHYDGPPNVQSGQSKAQIKQKELEKATPTELEGDDAEWNRLNGNG